MKKFLAMVLVAGVLSPLATFGALTELTDSETTLRQWRTVINSNTLQTVSTNHVGNVSISGDLTVDATNKLYAKELIHEGAGGMMMYGQNGVAIQSGVGAVSFEMDKLVNVGNIEINNSPVSGLEAGNRAYNDARYTLGAQTRYTNTAVTIVYDVTHSFHLLLTNDCTITFASWPTTYDAMVKIELEQDETGGHTADWPSQVRWSFAMAPTLSSGTNVSDIIYIGSADGGSTYYGVHSATEMPVHVEEVY